MSIMPPFSVEKSENILQTWNANHYIKKKLLLNPNYVPSIFLSILYIVTSLNFTTTL